MNRRILHHPLWTHSVAIAWIAWIVLQLKALGPLPARVPVHFDFWGQANRYGAPWEVWIFAVLVPAVMLGWTVVVDEIWARQEDRKRFNPLSLIDEATIGFLSSISVAYFNTLRQGTAQLTINWRQTAELTLGALAAAAIVEWLRPHRAVPRRIANTADADALRAELVPRIAAGDHWVFWQIQNPPYLNYLIVVTVIGLMMGAGLVIVASDMPEGLRWGTVAMMVLGASVALPCYGGLRVVVTPGLVRVRLGVWGIPLVRFTLQKVTAVEVQEFSPIRDFGGWGIRWAPKRGWGFFFRGTRGVSFTTSHRRKFMIGSDNPDALLVAIRAAFGMPYDGQGAAVPPSSDPPKDS